MKTSDQKKCTCCHMAKPLTEFYTVKDSWCKLCRRQSRRMYDRMRRAAAKEGKA